MPKLKNEILNAKKNSNLTYPSLRCPPYAFGVEKREIGGALRTRPYRG